MNETIKAVIDEAVGERSDEIISFAQETIRTQSMTCQEENMARLVEKKMRELGYDEVHVDETGNVLGRIGYGKNVLMFDSHMDLSLIHI